MAQITLDNIAHSYEPHPASADDFALKSLNHVWEDGGAYALLGPSGCGKTTLLNIISGLVNPTEGKILFDRRDVTALATERRNIAQVFQFPVVYDSMTVAENLAFPLRNRRISDSVIAERVKAAIAMLGLERLSNRKARGLTADEKQKISLGRGLVRTDVNAVLFDEPLTVIDPHLKWQLRSQLKSIHEQYSRTMIYVTHDQTEALTFADKVMVMLEGEVVQVGTPEELYNRPEHTFVGKFIGSPGMNLLPCELSAATLTIGQHRITLSREYPQLDGCLEMGIRPEFIELSESEDDIPVRITNITDTGRFNIVSAILGDQRIDIVAQEGEVIPAVPGVRFDPDRIHIYQDSHLVVNNPVQGDQQ
jgi:glycerol transport system ATP-binding protein